MQQKEFRIEKMLSGRRGFVQDSDADAVAALKRSLASLMSDRDGRRLTRAAAELGAAVESMEKAAQAVLAAAESIDDGMRAMPCAHAAGAGCETAPEMQQRIAQIYEACNFQDLAGQRIGKVIAMLMMVEERLVAMIQRHSGVGVAQQAQTSKPTQSTELINGPRLDGASGHASQLDIDAMFA